MSRSVPNQKHLEAWQIFSRALRDGDTQTAIAQATSGHIKENMVAGGTLLGIAAGYEGGTDCIRALVAAGLKVDKRGSGDATPLMAAVDAAVAQCLIDLGADINARDHMGRSVAYRLAQAGHTAALAAVVAAGADLSVRSCHGETPLHIASCHSQVNTTTYLLTQDVDLNARSNSGGTPLIHACGVVKLANARLLIEAGADVRIRDTTQMDALMHVLEFATGLSEPLDPAFVEMLIAAGADLTSTDYKGRDVHFYAKGHDAARAVIEQHLLEQTPTQAARQRKTL